jgi:hypothetical protein
MNPREVDTCAFRTGVTRRPGGEFADCRLAEAIVGPGPDSVPLPVTVPRAACEACCVAAPPRLDRLNEVIASFVYTHTRQIGREERPDGQSPAEASRLRERAAAALRVVWCPPRGAHDAGSAENLPVAAELVDTSVNPDTFARHLARGEPFAYLRYGDGEWLSILGADGANCDGHHFFPDTLGRELDRSLEYAAGLWPENHHFYMGLHTDLLRGLILDHLHEARLAYRVRWVKDHLFALGLRDLSTRRFFEAVRDHAGPKVLVGNESLAPAARGLGCRHVVIPRTDCYRAIDATEADCRSEGPGLVLSCAGMASECLLCRLHRSDPAGTYIDCGHIFDALVGHPSRIYTRNDHGGILGWLAAHYAGLLSNPTDR